MKAILQTKYGPPEFLELAEIEKPVFTENQVMLKVYAASVNALEWRPFTMSPFLTRVMGGLRKPKDPLLGTDVAGLVVTVGRQVTGFQRGDAVFGVAPGTFAEYARANPTRLVLKPANLSFEAAAAIPVAALTALQGLRYRGQVQPGQKVLVYGASGGVGTFAVQIAKAFGAEVTAACSDRNVAMLRSIGADHVMDYARDDFTQIKQRYDRILAVNGYRSIWDYRRALNPGGTCVILGGSMAQVLQGLLLGALLSVVGNKKFGFIVAQTNQQDLVALRELVEAGKVVPVIDRSYPLHEVPKALRYLIDEHAQGKVVITVHRETMT